MHIGSLFGHIMLSVPATGKNSHHSKSVTVILIHKYVSCCKTDTVPVVILKCST